MILHWKHGTQSEPTIEFTGFSGFGTQISPCKSLQRLREREKEGERSVGGCLCVCVCVCVCVCDERVEGEEEGSRSRERRSGCVYVCAIILPVSFSNPSFQTKVPGDIFNPVRFLQSKIRLIILKTLGKPYLHRSVSFPRLFDILPFSRM